MILYFCVLLVSRPGVTISFGSSLPTPVYKWPLNEETCGLEVEADEDAIFPKLENCIAIRPGVLQFSDNDILWENGFVKFKQNQQFIDVAISDNTPLANFGFSVYINHATAQGGTILHYVADSPSSSKFSCLRLFFEAGFLMLDLELDGTVIRKQTTFTGLNEWTIVGFSFGMSNSYGLFTKTSTVSETGVNSGGLAVPGLLRFGSKQAVSHIDPFQGKMACSMLFDQIIDQNDLEARDICKSYNTTITMNPMNSHLLIWPFDDTSFGMEVTELIFPLNHPDYRFADGPGALDGQALQFDGSVFTFLHTGEIEADLLIEQHSFGMYLYVDGTNDAILFHLYAPSLDATETRIWIYNTSLQIQLMDHTQQDCGHLEIQDVFTLNTWFVCAFTIKFPTEVRAIVNGVEFTGTHTCGGPRNSASGYHIGIGHGEWMLEGFRGRIRCLILLKEMTDVEHVLINACSKHFNISGLSWTHPELLHSYSRLVRRDASPNVAPLQSNVVKSLIACCVFCLQTPYCRSYTYGHHGNCQLYDLVMIPRLTANVNRSYYILHID